MKRIKGWINSFIRNFDAKEEIALARSFIKKKDYAVAVLILADVFYDERVRRKIRIIALQALDQLVWQTAYEKSLDFIVFGARILDGKKNDEAIAKFDQALMWVRMTNFGDRLVPIFDSIRDFIASQTQVSENTA